MHERLRPARNLCDFDSSVAAVRAAGRFLRGRDFRPLGVAPGSAPLAGLATALPAGARRGLFAAAGRMQSTPPARARTVTADDLARWTVAQYGDDGGPYPAAFVGSVGGAAVHLAAALHAPVLPQTYLLPVRARLDPDRPRAAPAAGRELGRHLADADPGLAVCHVHDPCRDRPMLARFMYYRLKRLRLGAVLRDFLERRLRPGAVIFILDCSLRWPVTYLGERQYFQFGALGGMSPQEYMTGSDRLAEHLAEQGAEVSSWHGPEPDGEYPEAEWGYDDALTADLTALATERGYRVRRLTSAEPERLSPLTAELFRWWLRRRGLPDSRLLVETYHQWQPYWTQRLGAVPFWLQSTARPSLQWLEHHMAGAELFDRIGVNLFSNGLRSVGQVPAGEWAEAARRHAGVSGGTLGVDEDAFPEDFGAPLRHRSALAALPERHPMPPPLSVAELDEFLSGAPRHIAAAGPVPEPR